MRDAPEIFGAFFVFKLRIGNVILRCLCNRIVSINVGDKRRDTHV